MTSMIGGDVARSTRAGEAPRHHLPVPLHEDVGDHRLQDQDRHHDDQDRARVEALRQAVRQRRAEMRKPEPLRRAAPPSTSRRQAWPAKPLRQPKRVPMSPIRAMWRGPCRCTGRMLVHQQPVANSARRLQVDRVGGVRLDLAAQAVDLDVDGALAAAVGDFQELVPLARSRPGARRRCAGSRARGR